MTRLSAATRANPARAYLVAVTVVVLVVCVGQVVAAVIAAT